MTIDVWTDAVLAASLFAVDPRTGIVVRALPGPVRDRYLRVLRAVMPTDAAWRRLPLHASDDRLLGGLDLTATLQAGRPVAASGLLAEADGGIVLLAMAERATPSLAAHLGATIDTGEVVAERDGLTLRSRAEIGVVAFDEGIDDERTPDALGDRLAFRVDLAGIGLRHAAGAPPDPAVIAAGRERLRAVMLADDMLTALAEVAAALGVEPLRGLLLAARVARASAAMAGRAAVNEEDTMVAARLVLAPRATRLPAPPEDQPPSEDSPPPEEADMPDPETSAEGDRPLADMVLDATRAAMPPGLLAQLLAGSAIAPRRAAAGRAGTPAASARRGRPIGVRRGAISDGVRLNLIETLRAAAPWQSLRRRTGASSGIIVRPDDVRITRFRQRTESTTIFLVDASGSTALARLGEAKGAVELVLAECYVRRDQVALIAFRGAGADLLLPPTGSLVRAKRSLARLPGGGATPLAAGLDAAAALADAVRRRGRTPVVLLLSDGRANIARDGTPGRVRAEEDAVAAGRAMRAAGIACVLVDTAPRPTPQARHLAAEMGARYLPLPYADAAALSHAVRATING